MAKTQYKETTVYEKLYGKPKKYQYYPVKFRIYPSNDVANGIYSIIKTSNSFVKTFFKFITSNEELYEKSIRLIENINNPELACIILLREMVKSFKEECKSGCLSQEEFTIKSLFVFNYDDLPSAHIEYLFKNIGDEYYKYYKKHGRSFEDIGEFQSHYMKDMNWIYCRDKGGLYFYDIGKNICYIKLPKLGIINKNVKDLFESDGLSDDAVLPVGFVTVDEDDTTKEPIFFISFAVRPEDVKVAFKRDVSEISLVFYGKYFTNVQIFYPRPDSKVDSIDGFGKDALCANKALEYNFEEDLVGRKVRYPECRKYFEKNLYVQAFLDSLKEMIISLDPESISILNIATAFDFIQDPDNVIGINFLFYLNEFLEELSSEFGFKIRRYDETDAEFYYCLECEQELSTFNDNDRQRIEDQSIFKYLNSINTDEDDDNVRTGCHGNGCGVSHKLITHTGIKLIKLAINSKIAVKKNPAKK